MPCAPAAADGYIRKEAMNEDHDNTNEAPASSGDDLASPDAAVEKLLRKWGAEESVRSLGALPPMRLDGPAARTMSPWLRWGPLAAAAVLLVAAGGLFVASLPWQRTPPGRLNDLPAASERPEDQPANLKREIAQLREQLEQALSRYDAQAVEYRQAMSRLDREKTQLAAALSRVEAGRTALETDLRREKSLLADARVQLGRDEDELAGLRKRVSTAESQLVSERKRLSAAAVELAKVRGMRDRAIAAGRGTREQVLALRAGHRGRDAQFQRMYLSVAGEGGVSLSARQQASRRSGMLRRCAELRPGVRAEATGRLFDRLEVILTRLELLDAGRAGSAGTFAGLVGGGLIERIDAALAGETTKVQAWLIEAKMILAGANSV